MKIESEADEEKREIQKDREVAGKKYKQKRQDPCRVEVDVKGSK